MARIGIDLGGTNIVAGVVDDGYHILAKAKRKTAVPRPAEQIVDDMAACAREAVETAGLTMDRIEAVGVGSPGVCNGQTGVVERADNLGFSHVPLREMLGARLRKPIGLENDANAAAYAEYLAGAAQGKKSCVCITLGTGVGGGVVTDGVILTGFNYGGAELGHTVIVMDGEPCSCGRRGCLEAYASATALIRQTRRAMQADPDSAMWSLAGSLDEVSGRTAYDGMRAGDATAAAVVDRYQRYIACGLTNMINIFQPEVLCIGGGICNEGDTLLEPLRALVRAEQFGQDGPQTLICRAKLGNDAGIIGAAYLEGQKA